MTLNNAEAGREYIVRAIQTDDEEMDAFLFSLGCFSGEPITVVSRLKGGCVVAVKQRLGLPVRFIGVGEGIDDLIPFTPEGFVEELLPRQWKH